jgi:uncharacterized membrane protein
MKKQKGKIRTNWKIKIYNFTIEFGIFDLCALVAVILFTVAGILVSLNRFWQYEASYIDFGQYDRAIWLVSRFQEPIFYHFIHGRINVLGDHVTPSVFLISPFYWFTNKSEMILVVQAIVVGLSGLFLYDIARIILKNKLAALSILISYCLFVGLQNAVITEFHELTVMTLPFMITFWAILKNKKITFYIALLIMLGCKEVTFATGITLGIALFFLKKDWRKHAIATILISAAWGFIAFKLIIPYYNHGQYLYAASIPSGIIPKITALFDQPEKRHTLLYSFFSFSFLPILAPQFWLMILQDYASRFIPRDFVTRWGLGLHYNAQSAVILALASIFALRLLFTLPILKKFNAFIAIIIILNAIFLFRFILHGPFLLATNQTFYQDSNNFKFLDTMVKQIPANASVMTQNDLAIRFTHQDVRLISTDYQNSKPDYILFDLRPGQNPNNYFGINNINNIFKIVSQDTNYKNIYHTQYQFIFERKHT